MFKVKVLIVFIVLVISFCINRNINIDTNISVDENISVDTNNVHCLIEQNNLVLEIPYNRAYINPIVWNQLNYECRKTQCLEIAYGFGFKDKILELYSFTEIRKLSKYSIEEFIVYEALPL